MKGKVFFVASYAESLINFRLQLMQAFLSKGYKVIAIAPKDEEVKFTLAKFKIEFIDIPLQRNGTNPLSDFKFFRRLRRIFLSEKPDIVFSYTIKPVIYASLAARKTGVSSIFALMTGTGYAFENTNWKNRLVGGIARKLLKMALNCTTKVLFQNPDNLAFFLNNNIIPKDKATAVVNGSGVDCVAFSPAPYPKQLSFLMIGRLIHYKGVYDYVNAARKFKKVYPEARFRLAGWLDTNPETISQKELDQWIKNGDIEFLGKLSDVRSSIADSSVYVLPSWNEGMPRTVLEAMAMARPIITTNAPGCKETVTPLHNGFLVSPKNVDELFKAMEYFILHPEKISSMGKASRDMVLDKFDVNKVNNAMLREMESNTNK